MVVDAVVVVADAPSSRSSREFGNAESETCRGLDDGTALRFSCMGRLAIDRALDDDDDDSKNVSGGGGDVDKADISGIFADDSARMRRRVNLGNGREVIVVVVGMSKIIPPWRRSFVVFIMCNMSLIHVMIILLTSIISSIYFFYPQNIIISTFFVLL